MRNFLIAAVALLSSGANVMALQPGVYAFFSAQTGQVLDIWQADKREGAALSTSQWTQGLNQAFAVQTDDNQNFGIAPFHTLRALTVTEIQKDVEVTQRNFVHAPSQQWRIIPKEKGLVAIQSKVSNKFMTAGARAGDKVVQSNGNGKANQLFRPFKLDHTVATPIKQNSIYTFINRGSTLTMEVSGASNNNGAKVGTWDNLNVKHQQFQIVTSVSTPEYVRLKAVNSNKFMTLHRDGSITQEDKQHLNRSQLWRFIESEDGTYQIENQQKKDALTFGRKGEAATLRKTDALNKNQQFWAIEQL